MTGQLKVDDRKAQELLVSLINKALEFLEMGSLADDNPWGHKGWFNKEFQLTEKGGKPGIILIVTKPATDEIVAIAKAYLEDESQEKEWCEGSTLIIRWHPPFAEIVSFVFSENQPKAVARHFQFPLPDLFSQ